METPAEYKVNRPGTDLVVMPPIEVGQGITLTHPLELVRQMSPFVQNANDLAEQADRAVIETDGAYVKGSEFLSTCTQQWNAIEDLRKAAKVPVDELARFIQNQCKPAQDLLVGAKQKLERVMLAYGAKIKAEREAAARLVQQQQEAEALRLAEAEEAKGNTAAAAAIVDAATIAAPVRAAAPIGGARTNSMGRSTNTATTWQGTPVEPMTVLAAIIKGTIPVSCIEWKQGELNKVAKAVGVEGTFNGLKIEKVESLRQR